MLQHNQSRHGRANDLQPRSTMTRRVPRQPPQAQQPEVTSAEAPQMPASSVDQAIEDSFPASDPPPWTSGIVRPAPAIATAPLTP